ncbi:hypothetical protein SLA2020_235930 [Shorea laevis]
MAAFEHFKDMYDVKLKPPMLRTLIKKNLPDEKQLASPELFGAGKDCLHYPNSQSPSESFEQESTDQKLIKSWTSAIDDWVNRVLLLVSSNMPDKCWVGICLLGLTCQECSSAPFLSSYSTWFQKLLSHLQPPADSQLVKVASCTLLSDLLTRLGRFSNVSDGTSHSGKLIQPVLKLINEDSAEAVWMEQSVPYIPLQHSFQLPFIIIMTRLKLLLLQKLSGKCSPKMLKKLGYCLAFLPKTKGDEDSWSFTLHKILVLINDHLNDVFQGLEEEAKSAKVRRLLVPVGKDPPPPLGGHTSLTGALDKTIKRSDQLLTSSVSTLMICCCKLLTSSYPAQVTIPIRLLLAVIERVLMVDSSCPQTMLPFMSSMQQELICSELPVLHLHSLDLLIAIIKGMRSEYIHQLYFDLLCCHLLPHAAEVVRLITKYFRRCGLPKLRTKLYSITRILLISMGVGMAIYLAQDVIDNAYIDLNPVLEENVGTSVSNPNSTNIQAGKRRRKHSASFGSSE